MLILQTLQWGAQHGYGIGQALRAQSGEVLQVETGSLYPALHRMERQGWILSKWGDTEQNQRAKYYRITAEGKKQLARDRSMGDNGRGNRQHPYPNPRRLRTMLRSVSRLGNADASYASDLWAGTPVPKKVPRHLHPSLELPIP